MNVGSMAIHNFPMADSMLLLMGLYVDAFVVRWDINAPAWQKEKCITAMKSTGKPYRCFNSSRSWNRFNWRNELVLATRYYNPSLIVNLDHDEAFLDQDAFFADMCAFINSDFKIAMFDYTMITCDGREVPKYPRARHCKVFKYERGINFDEYRGYGIPKFKHAELAKYMAQSKVTHYCFYTHEMQRHKKPHK